MNKTHFSCYMNLNGLLCHACLLVVYLGISKFLLKSEEEETNIYSTNEVLEEGKQNKTRYIISNMATSQGI